MYTRCPHCDTVFRVTPQQLQVSSGQVRCGRCQEVFDAFSTLSSRLPGGKLAPTPASVRSEPEPTATTAAVAPSTAAEIERRAPSQKESAETRTARAPTFLGAKPGAQVGAEPEVLTLPDELFSGAVNSARRWPWLLANGLVVLTLAAQAAWFFPGEMAMRVPELRPVLVQYCAWAGCEIRLPRLPDLLLIEASDLQLLDPAHPNEVLLTATIRNRARVEQALPMLELTLTDAANSNAARKVFAPADYLGANLPDDRGIGPSREVSIRLYLDTGDVKATGYRLYLFFA